MAKGVIKRDIPRFNLGLHLTPYLKKCDQKIFHGKFLYLSFRFEMQRSLIWDCSRAKLNLGGGVCRKALENGKVRIVIGGVRVCLVGIFAQYS